MKVYGFLEQLQLSQSKEGAFDLIYHNYFKNVKEIRRIDRMDRQRAGVDTEVTLESGEKIVIQEKWRQIRFMNDFLIEICSVETNGACNKPGWIYTIDADYIFVAFPTSQLVKIYPVAQLKLVWSANKDEWVKKYRNIYANNPGYKTRSVVVPCDVLERKMMDQMTFNYQRVVGASYGGKV